MSKEEIRALLEFFGIVVIGLAGFVVMGYFIVSFLEFIDSCITNMIYDYNFYH